MTHEPQTVDDQAQVALDVLLDPADPSDDDIATQPDLGPLDPDLRPGDHAATDRGGTPSGNSINAYLAEIARIPLLDAAEELALARRVQDGLAARALLHTATEPGVRLPEADQAAIRAAVRDGQDATEAMIQANLRLVVSIARRYLLSGVSLLDLVQDGNLGLMRAVEKFDPARGFKFSTYASWWIRQACLRGCVLRRQVRLPDEVHWQVQRLRRAEISLGEARGCKPSDADLAEHLDLPVGRVIELRGLPSETISLSLPMPGEGDATLGDLLPDDEAVPLADQVVAQQLPAALRTVLATLPDRERHLLELRFGFGETEPHTLDEIAHHFGVSRGRVRQLEVRALKQLRRHPDTLELRDWVTQQ
jgi:RNA polymerase primary sigma factor